MSPLQDFADFLQEEIETTKRAINYRYGQIAGYSKKVQEAHADREKASISFRVICELNNATIEVEYEEATLNIYTRTQKKLLEHKKEGTMDEFITTLLHSLEREIRSDSFGNKKLSPRDKAYADANRNMFRLVIPMIGYKG